MANENLVSVILPVYNGERYLGEAIESILSQDYRPIEIIVVNDGSTDNTENIAKQYDNDIIYVLQKNSGPAAARNKGLHMASGDIMGFLDADDLWSKNKLSRQLAHLADDPSAEIIVGLSQPMKLQTGEEDKSKFEKWHNPYCALVFGAALIRKSVFDKLGFFDETLIYGEDTDWFMRARETGVSMIILPEVTLFYRRHEYNMTLDSAAQNRYFIKALKKSLDRRRQTNSGQARSLPELSFGRKESGRRHSDSGEGQAQD